MQKKCYRSKGLVYLVMASFWLLILGEPIQATKSSSVKNESRPVVRIKKAHMVSLEQQERFEKALDEGKKLYNEMDNHGAITKLQEALGLAQTQQQKSDVYFYLSLAYFALTAEGQNAQFTSTVHKLIEVDYYRVLDTHLCPQEYLDTYNEIKESYGVLKVQSLPAGADVFVNDSRRSSGITPLTVAVLSGAVKIEVRKGSKKAKDTVRVAAGTQTTPPPYELKGGSSTMLIVGGVLLAGGLGAALALGGGGGNGENPPPPSPSTTGTLQINSTPSGAQVILDGTDRGVTTNTSISSIPAGNHEVVLIKQGYRDYNAQVSITAGQTTTHNASLNKHVIQIDQPQQGSEWASGTVMEIIWDLADAAQSRTLMPVLKSTSSALSSMRGVNSLRTSSQNISTSPAAVSSRSQRVSGASLRTARTRVSPLARTPNLTRRIPYPGTLAGPTRNPVSLQPQMQTLDNAGALVLDTVKIELLMAGEFNRTIVDSTENDGSFNWGIPASIPVGNDFRIRISSVDSPEVTYNSAKFSITKPSSLAAPTNLKASVYASDPLGSLIYAVDLSWRDRSDNEKGFRIERKTSGSPNWTVIKTVNANVTSFTDSGLLGDRSYSYRVFAYNNDGKSGYSNQVELHVVDYPTNLTVASQAGPAAGLSWKDNSSLETGFQIYRKTDTGNWILQASVGANVTTYTDNSVGVGLTYSYRVRAYASVSEGTVYSEYSETKSVTFPAAIAAPTSLKTDPYYESPAGSLTYSVKLSWTDNSNNETGFRIERKDTVNTTWQVIKTVGANATSYTDTGLMGDRSYSYRVFAYNNDGKSGNSNQVDVPIVDPPTNLTVASQAGPSAGLSWKDNSSLETGFQIYRKTDSGSWVLLASVAANVTTYVDNSVGLHAYSYRIRAYTNVFGGTVYSEYSETKSVTFN